MIELSTINLTSTYKSTNLKEISKPKKITSESREYHIIIGVTCLIFAAVLALGIIGPLLYSYYGGMTSLGLTEMPHAYRKSTSSDKKDTIRTWDRLRQQCLSVIKNNIN